MHWLALVVLCLYFVCACTTWHEDFSQGPGAKMPDITQPQYPTHVDIELQNTSIHTEYTINRRHWTGGSIWLPQPVALDFRISAPDAHIVSISPKLISLTDSEGNDLTDYYIDAFRITTKVPSDAYQASMCILSNVPVDSTVMVQGEVEMVYTGVTYVKTKEYGGTPKPHGPHIKARVPFSMKVNILTGEQTAFRFPLPERE